MPYEAVRPKSMCADWTAASVVDQVTMPTVAIFGLSEEDGVKVQVWAGPPPAPAPPVIPATPVVPAAPSAPPVPVPPVPLPPWPALPPAELPPQPEVTSTNAWRIAAANEEKRPRMNGLLRGCWISPPPRRTSPCPSGHVRSELHRTRFQDGHVPGRWIAAIAAEKTDQPGPLIVDAGKAGAIVVFE